MEEDRQRIEDFCSAMSIHALTKLAARFIERVFQLCCEHIKEIHHGGR